VPPPRRPQPTAENGTIRTADELARRRRAAIRLHDPHLTAREQRAVRRLL
jgi:hypothetical protein